MVVIEGIIRDSKGILQPNVVVTAWDVDNKLLLPSNERIEIKTNNELVLTDSNGKFKITLDDSTLKQFFTNSGDRFPHIYFEINSLTENNDKGEFLFGTKGFIEWKWESGKEPAFVQFIAQNAFQQTSNIIRTSNFQFEIPQKIIPQIDFSDIRFAPFYVPGFIGSSFFPKPINESVPVILLPIRMEIRKIDSNNIKIADFSKLDESLRVGETILSDAIDEYWIRWYPDDIHIEPYVGKIKENEIIIWDESSEIYRNSINNNLSDIDQDEIRQAWYKLGKLLNPIRAKQLVKNFQLNDDLKPKGLWDFDYNLDYTGFDADKTINSDALNLINKYGIKIKTFPDKIHLYTIKGNNVQYLTSGESIPDELTISLDDLNGNSWMSNFEKAIEMGMGIKVNQPDKIDQINNADWLISLGINDPVKGIQYLKSVFIKLNALGNMSIVAQDSPTNNTENSKTDYSDIKDDFVEYLKDSFSPNNQFENSKGMNSVDSMKKGIPDFEYLANLFNSPSYVFNNIEGSHLSEQNEATSMALLLWDACTFLIRSFLQNSIPNILDNWNQLKNFFIQHVRARGNFPIVRFDENPYGIQPVIPFNEWKVNENLSDEEKKSFETIHTFINLLRTHWSRYTSELVHLSSNKEENKIDYLMKALQQNRTSKRIDTRVIDHEKPFAIENDPNYANLPLVTDEMGKIRNNNEIEYLSLISNWQKSSSSGSYRFVDLHLKLDEYDWDKNVDSPFLDNYDGVAYDEKSENIYLILNNVKRLIPSDYPQDFYQRLFNKKREDLIKDDMTIKQVPFQYLSDGATIPSEAKLFTCIDPENSENKIYFLDKDNNQFIKREIRSESISDYQFDSLNIFECYCKLTPSEEYKITTKIFDGRVVKYSSPFIPYYSTDIFLTMNGQTRKFVDNLTYDYLFNKSTINFFSKAIIAEGPEILKRFENLSFHTTLLKYFNDETIYLLDRSIPEYGDPKPGSVTIEINLGFGSPLILNFTGVRREVPPKLLDYYNFNRDRIYTFRSTGIENLPLAGRIPFNFDGALIGPVNPSLVDKGIKRQIVSGSQLFKPNATEIGFYPIYYHVEDIRTYNAINENIEQAHDHPIDEFTKLIRCFDQSTIYLQDHDFSPEKNIILREVEFPYAFNHYQFDESKINICYCNVPETSMLYGKYERLIKNDSEIHLASEIIDYSIDINDFDLIETFKPLAVVETQYIYDNDIPGKEKLTYLDRNPGRLHGSLNDAGFLRITGSKNVFLIADNRIRFMDPVLVEKYLELDKIPKRNPSPLLKRLLYHLFEVMEGISIVNDEVMRTNKDIIIDEIKLASSKLKDLSIDKLEILLTEILDLLTYRIDSWITAFSHQRLLEFQKANTDNSNPVIGGYGWLSNPGKLDNSKEQEAEYIQTPSLSQANTAAILRNASIGSSKDPGSNPDEINIPSYNINLSSERIRNGLWYLESLRMKHLPEELLGYKIERIMHDEASKVTLAGTAVGDTIQEVDIYKLREKYPIALQKDMDSRNNVDGSDKRTFVETIINGIEAIDDRENLSEIFESQAKIDKINRVYDKVAQVKDASTDLAMAEVTYQFMQGNTARTGAWLDFLDGEGLPPNVEFVKSHRFGDRHSVKLLLLVPSPDKLYLTFDEFSFLKPRKMIDPILANFCNMNLFTFESTNFSVSIKRKGRSDDDRITLNINPIGDLNFDNLDLFVGGYEELLIRLNYFVVNIWRRFDAYPFPENELYAGEIYKLGGYPHSQKLDQIFGELIIEPDLTQGSYLSNIIQKVNHLRSVLQTNMTKNQQVSVLPENELKILTSSNYETLNPLLMIEILARRAEDLLKSYFSIKISIDLQIHVLMSENVKRKIKILYLLKELRVQINEKSDVISAFEVIDWINLRDQISALDLTSNTFVNDFKVLFNNMETNFVNLFNRFDSLKIDQLKGAFNSASGVTTNDIVDGFNYITGELPNIINKMLNIRLYELNRWTKKSDELDQIIVNDAEASAIPSNNIFSELISSIKGIELETAIATPDAIPNIIENIVNKINVMYSTLVNNLFSVLEPLIQILKQSREFGFEKSVMPFPEDLDNMGEYLTMISDAQTFFESKFTKMAKGLTNIIGKDFLKVSNLESVDSINIIERWEQVVTVPYSQRIDPNTYDPDTLDPNNYDPINRWIHFIDGQYNSEDRQIFLENVLKANLVTDLISLLQDITDGKKLTIFTPFAKRSASRDITMDLKSDLLNNQLESWFFDTNGFSEITSTEDSHTGETIINNPSVVFNSFAQVRSAIKNLIDSFSEIEINDFRVYHDKYLKTYEKQSIENSNGETDPVNQDMEKTGSTDYLYMLNYDFSIGTSFNGILVDQWTEFFPNPEMEELTGITYKYNSPQSEAPNTIIVALPPEFNKPIVNDRDYLARTVKETIDLMKLRMVGTDEIVGSNNLGRIFPALFFGPGLLNLGGKYPKRGLFPHSEKLLYDYKPEDIFVHQPSTTIDEEDLEKINPELVAKRIDNPKL